MVSAMKVKTRKARFSPLTIIMFVVLTVYSILLIALLGYALITALKRPMDFSDNQVGLPDPWYFKNFSYILKNAQIKKAQGVVNFGRIIWNSIYYSVGCALVNTVVLFAVAYVCARYKCKFSKIIYSTVLIVMVIPIVGNQTSELQVSIALGLYDKMIGMLVMRASFLGIYFLIFYDIFDSIPMAYSEAAEIDGAGDMQIMLKIFFPMTVNTFLTIFLISFIGYWNNYQVPMVYVPNSPTLSEYMFSITTNESQGDFVFPPVQLAAALMLLLPVVAIFVVFSNKLLGNLSVGGVKG
mgnify:FL=1